MGKKKKKEKVDKVQQVDNTEKITNNTILAVPDETEKEPLTTTVEPEPETDNEKTDKVTESNSTETHVEEVTKKDEEKPVEPKETQDKEVLENKADKPESTKEVKENNQLEVINNNTDKKKSYLKVIIIVCIITGFSVLTLLFSTIFALFNSTNPNIINGTYIKSINVSNLSKDQALNTLNEDLQNKLSKVITLKHNEYETQISLSQLELKYNFEDAVNEVYSKGHSGNIFKDNYDIILSLFTTTTTNPGFSYNKEILNSLVNEIEVNIDDKLVEPSYYIDENNLIIVKGKDGYVIDTEFLENILNNIFSDIDNQSMIIDIPVAFKKCDNVNISKIQSEVCKSPVNAYFTKDPYVIYPHVDGIEFAISIQEAQNIIDSSTEEEIAIPLTVTSPEVTTKDLGDEAFPDELSTFDTTYSTNNVTRSTNIRLASNKVNGTVVMPGEVFSYNATVGKRTTEAGFQTAAVYSGGEVTTGIGGGICQVSSTLYNAVLLANLEIVERQNHGFNPGYVPVSRDATVSWGAPDFKFKNTRNYPIKIICDGDGGRITVDILGLKEEVEYDVEIESYITSYIAYSTITRVDPNLEPGESRVIQSGSSGCRSVAYRILYLNGDEVSRELLSQDTYSPHNKIVAVGN